MANWREELLLEGDFCIPPKRRTLFKVTLTPLGLFYSQLSATTSQYEEKSLQISDIIGCHCSSTDLPTVTVSSDNINSNAASFTVYAYPFRKKIFSGKKTRHRVNVTFEIRSYKTQEENIEQVYKWRNVICCLARGLHIKPYDVANCQPPPWGQFLILVNPHSGPGRALQIFKNEVQPMLEEAGIPFKLVITEYAGHAQDMIQKMDLGEWASIVIMSGDGLIFEVINGLMQRVDWTSAIHKPVGCLPGGSGNALACAINYAAGEPVLINPVLHSTFVLIKHKVVPMDLVLVQTPSKQFYSFLSVTWGIVADIDFESEKYRNLGEARFTLGAIKRIVNLRSYSGRLSFLPVAEYTPKNSLANMKTLKKIRRFSLRSASNSIGSVDSLDSKHSKSSSVVLTATRSLESTSSDDNAQNSYVNGNGVIGGGDVYFSIAEQNENESTPIHKPQTRQSHLGAGEGQGEIDKISSALLEQPPRASSAAVVEITSATEIGGTSSQNLSQLQSAESSACRNAITNGDVSSFSSEVGTLSVSHRFEAGLSEVATNNDFEEETVYASKKDGEAVPTPLLPPLDQPVPNNWVVVEGKFVLACALYQTHLGSDMLAAPSARLADGIIHLMFVRDGISRNHLLNLFLTFSEGSHVDSPEVEFVPVLAFRLEPDLSSCGPGGHLMIDGERIDPTPVQAQVLPSLARIMAIQ